MVWRFQSIFYLIFTLHLRNVKCSSHFIDGEVQVPKIKRLISLVPLKSLGVKRKHKFGSHLVKYNLGAQHSHVMHTESVRNDAGGRWWIKPPTQLSSSAFLLGLGLSQNQHVVAQGPLGFSSQAPSSEFLISQPFPTAMMENVGFKEF